MTRDRFAEARAAARAGTPPLGLAPADLAVWWAELAGRRAILLDAALDHIEQLEQVTGGWPHSVPPLELPGKLAADCGNTPGDRRWPVCALPAGHPGRHESADLYWEPGATEPTPKFAPRGGRDR